MKTIFKTLSIFLDYPNSNVVALIRSKDRLRSLLNNEDPEVAGYIINFIESIENTIPNLDEIYVKTFEVGSKCSLYAHQYVVRDKESEVGDYLLKLKTLYKKHGFDMVTSKELPDYLPVMLEFLSLIWDRNPEVRKEYIYTYLKPLIPRMLKCLSRIESPYIILIRVLDKILKKI